MSVRKGRNVVASMAADLAVRTLRLAPTGVRAYLTLAGRLGYVPRYRNPRTFNEKLVWLLRNTEDERRAHLADKLGVKAYVARVAPEARTPAVLTAASRGEDLELHDLPDVCVLKANNGYARNLVLRAPHDRDAIVRQANAWLARDPCEGLFPWESWYRSIPPRVFIETFVGGDGSSLPTDYKVFVFHGRAVIMQVMSDRVGASMTRLTVDRAWQPMVGVRPSLPWQGPLGTMLLEAPEPPPQLERLLAVSEALAGDVPFVRVDAYLTQREVVIGELTFSPSGGAVPFPFDLDLRLGGYLHLP